MEIVKRLQLEINKGFSKSELERIVDLPLNTLSSILTRKKKMTAKHELSVTKFLDEHPNLSPLDYPKRTRKPKEPQKERQEKTFPPPPDKKARQKKSVDSEQKNQQTDKPLTDKEKARIALMNELDNL